MGEEQSGDDPGDGPWVTVAAAARHLGISPRAIRGRIRRGTIEWKPQGNTGRLVRVPKGDVSPDGPGDGPEDELDQLRAEVDQLREEREEARITAAKAEARAEAVREMAEARVDAAKAQAAAGRQLADRLTQELADVRRELAETRMPWLLRLVLALRG